MRNDRCRPSNNRADAAHTAGPTSADAASEHQPNTFACFGARSRSSQRAVKSSTRDPTQARLLSVLRTQKCCDKQRNILAIDNPVSVQIAQAKMAEFPGVVDEIEAA